MMRKMVFLLLSFVLFFVLCSVSESKTLKKGEVYSLLDGGETMEVISDSELEITERGKTVVTKYKFKGDKLRVVANVLGTERVYYYLITQEGLKGEKTGQVYYSKAGLAAKKKEQKEQMKISDLTVLFKGTGLMWARDANIVNEFKTLDGAFNFIASLNEIKYGGYSDWRLPNKEELESLLTYCKKSGIPLEEGKCAMYYNKIGFKNVKSNYYWSSTSGALDIWNGYVGSESNSGSIGYVWPVRSGQ